VQSRLQKLVRSVGDYPKYGSVYNSEHNAGYLLRRITVLSERFPQNALALSWSYCDDCLTVEKDLLYFYAKSFGELPPLNRKG